MISSGRPLVDVIMVTYNHEKYISQAIESVLCQKCNFNIRLIIGEDSSTDRTGDICEYYAKLYPEKILLLRNPINFGLIKNYKEVFNQCSAKYVAILEGDDYWTDEYKLTKQINILEQDESIGLVFTNYSVLYEDGSMKLGISPLQKTWKSKIFNDLLMLKRSGPAPLTSCFRLDLVKEFFDFNFCIQQNCHTLDFSLWLELSYHKQFMYIPDNTATYRIIRTAITQTLDINKINKYNEDHKKVIEYYINRYSDLKINKKELIDNYKYQIIKNYLSKGFYLEAKKESRDLNNKKLKTFLILLASNNKVFCLAYIYLIKFLSNIKQIFYKMYIFFIRK